MRQPQGVWRCDLAHPYERAVANVLVELAWAQDSQNWGPATSLDGAPFVLNEPEIGVAWTREDFKLPEEGRLEIHYNWTPRTPRMKDAITPHMFEQLLVAMSDPWLPRGGMSLLRVAATIFHFLAEQLGRLVGHFSESFARVEMVELLLPRLIDVKHVTQQVYDRLTEKELSVLEHRMGSLFYFVPSNPTGHYRLELKNRYAREMIMRLMAINAEEKARRYPADQPRERHLIDLSQRSDQDNFRNEHRTDHRGRKMPFDLEQDDWAVGREPKDGLLEFDFSSSNVNRLIAKTPPMPDDIFELLLHELRLVKMYCVTQDEQVMFGPTLFKERIEGLRAEDARVRKAFQVVRRRHVRAHARLARTFQRATQAARERGQITRHSASLHAHLAFDEHLSFDTTVVDALRAAGRPDSADSSSASRPGSAAPSASSRPSTAAASDNRSSAATDEQQGDPADDGELHRVDRHTAGQVLASRPCWWSPRTLSQLVVASRAAHLMHVSQRMEMMVRRATLEYQLRLLRDAVTAALEEEYFFTVRQVAQIIAEVPCCGRPHVLLALINCVTDPETLAVSELLPTTYRVVQLGGSGGAEKGRVEPAAVPLWKRLSSGEFVEADPQHQARVGEQYVGAGEATDPADGTVYVLCQPVLAGLAVGPRNVDDDKAHGRASAPQQIAWINKLYLADVRSFDLDKEEPSHHDFRQRVGIINLFNPFLPDLYGLRGNYSLQLHKPEHHVIATLLLRLGKEQGEELLDDKLKVWVHTRSGKGRQNVSTLWAGDQIPRQGEVSLTFRTRPAGKQASAGANLSLRCHLGHQLKFPGTGRWRAVPVKDVAPAQEVDDGEDLSRQLTLGDDNHLSLVFY